MPHNDMTFLTYISGQNTLLHDNYQEFSKAVLHFIFRDIVYSWESSRNMFSLFVPSYKVLSFDCWLGGVKPGISCGRARQSRVGGTTSVSCQHSKLKGPASIFPHHFIHLAFAASIFESMSCSHFCLMSGR